MDAIKVAVVAMAQIYGMSPEQVIERCSIRELMLYISVMMERAAPDPAPDHGEVSDDDIAAFVAAVGHSAS